MAHCSRYRSLASRSFASAGRVADFGAELWTLDSRFGIALAPGQNTVVKGQLYTSEAIALKTSIGFVARVQGGGPRHTAHRGQPSLLATATPASVRRCTAALPELDPVAWAARAGFASCLTSPGILAMAGSLAGTDANGRWHFHALRQGWPAPPCPV